MRLAIGSILITAALLAPAQAALTIDIDYSLDAGNFFDPATPAGLSARAAMMRAAKTLGDRMLDSLSPINPAGDSWNTLFTHPASGAADTRIYNIAIPANTIKVYVGARSNLGSLAQGGPGGYELANDTSPLGQAVQYRGQPGAAPPAPTDFGTWGGAISFNSSTNWNFANTSPAVDQFDFLTVATHELAHVLGFGTADSFGQLQTGGNFTGFKSTVINGNAPVPLNNSENPVTHWAANVTGGDTAIAAMVSGLPVGTLRKFSLIDFAALDDLGWELARSGDANADGVVDFSDLATLAQNYNLPVEQHWSTGDFNQDFTTNFADLVAMAQNYGATGPQPASAISVPEPAILSMLLLPLVLKRRRRVN